MELALKKPKNVAAPITLYDSRATLENGEAVYYPQSEYNAAAISPTSIETKIGRIPAYSNGYMLYLKKNGASSMIASPTIWLLPGKDLAKYKLLKISYYCSESSLFGIGIGQLDRANNSFTLKKACSAVMSAYAGYTESEFDISDLTPITGEWAVQFKISCDTSYTYVDYVHRVSIE